MIAGRQRFCHRLPEPADRLAGHSRPLVIYASSTIWVCTVIASSRPDASVTRVCHTIVRRPRCSGVDSARTTPSRPASKKFVFDPTVVVVVPGGRLRNVRSEEHTSELQSRQYL